MLSVVAPDYTPNLALIICNIELGQYIFSLLCNGTGGDQNEFAIWSLGKYLLFTIKVSFSILKPFGTKLCHVV